LLKIAAAFQLSDAASIIDEVRDAVAQWLRLAQANEVSAATRNEIAGHLAAIERRFKK
jgi:hypothetical protein